MSARVGSTTPLDAGTGAANRKLLVSCRAPVILQLQFPEGSDSFHGKVQSTIDSEWSLDEPFVVSGQVWLGELVSRSSSHPELRDFLLSFIAAFDVSTFKHTLGRAVKKLPQDLAAARSTIVTHLKAEIVSVLKELRLPLVDELGVDEMQHADLIGACTVNAFCMAAGSTCAPCFEANEVDRKHA